MKGRVVFGLHRVTKFTQGEAAFMSLGLGDHLICALH